jgi:streptogrisin D
MVTVAKAAPTGGVARLTSLAERSAGVIEVVRTTEPLAEQDLLSPQAGATLLLGGDQISDGKIICSAGFNVVRNGQPYVLTAGHCTAGMPDWQDVGPSVAAAFPKTDYGLIRDDEAASAGDVDLYDGSAQPISTVGTPTVGEHVCASGMATQVTCGEVTALDQTVDYGDGDVVHGLIKTTVHTDHGDSGGALYDGSAGLGVVSGGDGTTDYFQPLTTAMSAYDLELAEP